MLRDKPSELCSFESQLAITSPGIGQGFKSSQVIYDRVKGRRFSRSLLFRLMLHTSWVGNRLEASDTDCARHDRENIRQGSNRRLRHPRWSGTSDLKVQKANARFYLMSHDWHDLACFFFGLNRMWAPGARGKANAGLTSKLKISVACLSFSFMNDSQNHSSRLVGEQLSHRLTSAVAMWWRLKRRGRNWEKI